MGRGNKKAKLKKAALLSAAQTKKARHKRKTETSTKGKGPGTPKYGVDDLLLKVEGCTDTFQPELACKFAERALELEPDNVQVLDILAPLLLEIGGTEKAMEYFKRCIALSPDRGHAKYLYMGQLTSGEDAIEYLTKGIAIMEGGEDVTNEEISTAYCSLAEIYLTDSCFAEGASENCYKCCCKAIELSPGNPETHQILASCLLSQGKQDDAKTSLMRGVSLWLPSKVGGASSSEGASSAAMSPTTSFPPYFSRVNTAKLLLEVQEYEVAFEVLEGLLHEDDEVVGVWYLMGWLHYLISEAESARFYLEQTQTLYTKLDCDEVDMLVHTQELLKELGHEEVQLLGDYEAGEDGREDDDSGESGSELLEEDNQDTGKMEVS